MRPGAAVHEVAAGVLVRDGKVLLCQRREDLAWHPGVWDVMGGHLEPGESAAQALARECEEELGVAVEDARALMSVSDDDVVLHLFLVTRWVGEPRNAAVEEHTRIGWFSLPEIGNLRLADARWLPLLRAALTHGHDQERQILRRGR